MLANLARIGARVPTYGDARDVVPADDVERWLNALTIQWERPRTSLAIVRMARLTGAASRDVSSTLRNRLLKEARKHGVPTDVLRPLREVVEVTSSERGASFGDALPPGLSLSS